MKWVRRSPEEGINVTPASPFRDAVQMLVGLVVLVVGCAVALVAMAELLVPLIPVSAELRIFGSFSQVLDKALEDQLGAETRPPSDELQDIMDRLGRHWPDHGYDFQVTVLEMDDLNAFAIPGGRILVTSGLLAGATSENEVAMVLGHELGHFHHRDHLRGLGRALAIGTIMAMVSGRGLGGDQAFNFSAQLASRSFDRDQESAADRFGLSLLQAEYGHIGGAADFFKRLAQSEEDDGAGAFSLYLGTHPQPEGRVDALMDEAASRGFGTTGVLVPYALSNGRSAPR